MLSGADVTISREPAEAKENPRKYWTQQFVANNVHNTRSWYQHPKILIVALNGPAVGLSAGLTAHADFIYAAPHTFLLTPFTSLGLMAEGGASKAFVDRLGISKANEALLMSRKIPAEDLLRVGYVNKIFHEGGGDKNTGKGMDSNKLYKSGTHKCFAAVSGRSYFAEPLLPTNHTPWMCLRIALLRQV